MTISDQWLSPQAAVLSPEATIRIAAAIVGADTPYHRVIAAGRAAVAIIKKGITGRQLHISRKEQQWLTRIDDALGAFPDDEGMPMSDLEVQYGSLYDKTTYGL